LINCLCGQFPLRKKKEASYYNRDEVIRLLEALKNVPESDLKFRVGILLPSSPDCGRVSLWV